MDLIFELAFYVAQGLRVLPHRVSFVGLLLEYASYALLNVQLPGVAVKVEAD